MEHARFAITVKVQDADHWETRTGAGGDRLLPLMKRLKKPAR